MSINPVILDVLLMALVALVFYQAARYAAEGRAHFDRALMVLRDVDRLLAYHMAAREGIRPALPEFELIGKDPAFPMPAHLWADP